MLNLAEVSSRVQSPRRLGRADASPAPAEQFPSLGALLIQERRPLIALVLICWLGNFLYFSSFGLYEDDLWQIGRIINHFGFDTFILPWVHWYGGRPLSHFLIRLLAFGSGAAGDLKLLYLFAFLIISTNAILLYVIFRRVAPILLCFLLAVFYSLSPFGTTRMFLVHAFNAHLSVTWALLGLLLSSRGAFKWAYAVSFLSLLTYELPWLLMLGAPFLYLRRMSPRDWRLLARHGLVMAALAGVYALIRLAVGEARLVDTLGRTGLLELSAQIFHAVAYNLSEAGATIAFTFRAVLAQGFTAGTLVALAIAAIVLVVVLRQQPLASGAFDQHRAPSADTASSLFCLAFAGLVVATGYLMSFFNFAAGELTQVAGRGTRAHAVAEVGYALLAATAFTVLLTRPRRPWRRAGALAGLFVLVAYLALYAMKVQEDYARAWRDQLASISAIIPLIGDAGPGDVIIYEQALNAYGAGIETISWSFNVIPGLLFAWPGPELEAPRIMPAPSGWAEHLRAGSDGTLAWTAPQLSGLPRFIEAPLEPGHVIVIQADERGHRRLEPPLVIDGVELLERHEVDERFGPRLADLPFQPLARMIFSEVELATLRSQLDAPK